MRKKNVLKLYKLPKKVEFCKTCVVSNQRPRTKFFNGECSACIWKKQKKLIKWNERKKSLVELLKKYKKPHQPYDVIVPCSGGKDGSFVANSLKELGMKPLCVTWAPLAKTEIGKKNLEGFLDAGFSHIMGTANREIQRKLTKLSLDLIGDPFQPFIYGQMNFPIKIADLFKINLIFYGENQELEYGGDLNQKDKSKRNLKDFEKYYFSNFPPKKLIKYGIKQRDLIEYNFPKLKNIKKEDFDIRFFSHYHNWDPQENYFYCINNTNLHPNTERSEGTYSRYASLDDKFDGFHFYLAYIKFGTGRAHSDAAQEVRTGKITREEAVELIKKYDSEFPKLYFKEFLEYCEITEKHFFEIINSWRSPHLWTKKNRKWVLKNPIWKK